MLLLIASCDDPPPRIERPAKSLVANFSSLLQLRANQRTLLAMSAGQLYFHQPDGSMGQALRSIDRTGQIRTTTLTPGRVARLLNASEGAAPSLRAIATLGDGQIAVYFNGSSRRESLACVVLFDPASDTARLIVSPADLIRESGMGAALDIADAQMVVSGTTLWLYLRHVDQAAYLRLDTRAVRSGEARVARAFDSLRTEEGPLPTQPEDVLSSHADGTIWLLRPSTGELWRLNRDGLAFPNKQPEGRPRLTVAPLLLPAPNERDRPLLSFFPAEHLTADTRGAVERSEIYPALIFNSKSEEYVIDRHHLDTRPAFPSYAMNLTNWVLEPQTADIFAYDAMSGEVFRITRAWQ